MSVSNASVYYFPHASGFKATNRAAHTKLNQFEPKGKIFVIRGWADGLFVTPTLRVSHCTLLGNQVGH